MIEFSYISFMDPGAIVIVNPAPILNAPYVASIAAPVIPSDPAMISTFPELYLCVSSLGL